MNKPQTQSGSVVAYAIAAVVLLALLAGAFYLAKHFAMTSTGDQPGGSTGPANNQTANDESNSKQSDQDQATDKRDDQSTKPGQASTDQSDTDSTKQRSGDANQPTNGSDTEQSSGTIAPAGPTDVVATVIGLAALTASGVAYFRSRRHLRSEA